MPEINKLFFELLRVAIGKQKCLSRTPNEDDWTELYALANKHALVGICFAGVQKLQLQQQAPSSVGSLQAEMLYLRWMGMAAKIQQRNELVNKRCMELEKKLAADGLKCCILKGQGVAQNYLGELRALRQSGDIDVWVDAGRDELMLYVSSIASTNDINQIHVHLNIYQDTDVELHYVPSLLSNRITNLRIIKWYNEQRVSQMSNMLSIDTFQIQTPSIEFNLVFLLLHVYKHLFGGGVGIRQIMDYYFVLQAFLKENNHDSDYYCRCECIKTTVDSFGLTKFATGMTWLMQKLFDLDMIDTLWIPNQREGEFLLAEIMQMGNFGQHDERFKLCRTDSHLDRYWQTIKSKWRFVDHYPVEVFWQPIDTFFRFFEIRMLRWKMSSLKNKNRTNLCNEYKL